MGDPDDRSFLVLFSLQPQIIQQILCRSSDAGSGGTKDRTGIVPIEKYPDARIPHWQKILEPQLVIRSSPRFGGVRRVVERVETMHGNDIYVSIRVVRVIWIDLSEETLRIGHIGHSVEEVASGPPDMYPHGRREVCGKTGRRRDVDRPVLKVRI